MEYIIIIIHLHRIIYYVTVDFCSLCAYILTSTVEQLSMDGVFTHL